ncbi:hypothetical protein MHYP_G00090410 [Metynnis hypsauchen]
MKYCLSRRGNANEQKYCLWSNLGFKYTFKEELNKLHIFINKCLRHILNIRWPEKISNTELWTRTSQKPVSEDIKKRKWGWIGHTLRKPADNVTSQALEWNPQGKRKVGRPKQTWRRSVESEAKSAEMTWTQLKKAAQNRVFCWGAKTFAHERIGPSQRGRLKNVVKF